MSAHIFNPHIANQVGVPAAVVYENIKFWCERNEANNKNFHDGSYWTYNSVEAFSKLFWYMTPKQIRTCLEKLVEDGLLLTGHFSKDQRDRTKWYAISGALHLSEKANVLAPQGKCYKEQIVNNTDSKQDIYIYTHANLPIEATQETVSSERLYEHKKAGISIELPADVSHEQFNQFVNHRIELGKSIKTKKINQRVAQLGLTQMQKLIAAGEDLSECLNVMELKGWDQPYAVNKSNGGQNNATNKQVRRTGFAEPSGKFETIIPSNAPEWLRD